MQNIFQLNPLVTTCRLKSSSSYERIKTQTGDSALVQSKSTKMIYINSIRIIKIYPPNLYNKRPSLTFTSDELPGNL